MTKKSSFLPEDARDISTLFEKKEVKAYSMAVFSFFAFAFFSVFAIRPTLMSFFHLQRQIEDSRELDQKLTGKINSLLRAQESYQMNQERLALLDESIPQDPQFPNLVRKMEGIVANEAATMTSFTTDNFSLLEENFLKKDEGIATVSFTLSVAGDYIRGESVLRRLANLRRIIMFETVKFDNSSNPLGNAVELSIDGRTYFFTHE